LDDRCMQPYLSGFLHWDGVSQNCSPRLAWNWDPPGSQFTMQLGITGMPLCPVIGWDGISWTFCPCWPQNPIFPISVSQVSGITGVSHWHPASSSFLRQLYRTWPLVRVILFLFFNKQGVVRSVVRI
jgi:hypothetical protein